MPKYQPHEIEQIAEAGWNAYAAATNKNHKATDEDPALPTWDKLAGEEKARQLQTCAAASEHGSDGSVLGEAYVKAAADFAEKPKPKPAAAAKVEPPKPSATNPLPQAKPGAPAPPATTKK